MKGFYSPEHRLKFEVMQGVFHSSGGIAVSTVERRPLYTDGVTEARNQKHEEFGIARLVDIVKSHRHQTAKEIEEAIVAAVRDSLAWINKPTM
jgi:hypothetical protein